MLCFYFFGFVVVYSCLEFLFVEEIVFFSVVIYVVLLVFNMCRFIFYFFFIFFFYMGVNDVVFLLVLFYSKSYDFY